jgi:hypothetical protein
MSRFNLPAEAAAIRLCKVVKGDLILCEAVIFEDGVSAVDTILRRASLSGNVGPVGDTGDYWADLLNAEADTIVETVALDRRAWNAIKNQWARCRIEVPLRARAAVAGLR